LLKVTFLFIFSFREVDEFVEFGHKISYSTAIPLTLKADLAKNLHAIWPGEQFKVCSFFLKHFD